MIEVSKITYDIYDPDASLKLAYHSDSITIRRSLTESGNWMIIHFSFQFELYILWLFML